MDFTVDELLQQLNSQDPEERLFALVYIARLGVQEAIWEVIAMLKDPDLEVRSTAAWALDLMGNPASIPALLGALYDPEYHVRSTAGWALLHMGEPAIPYVVDVLRSDPSPEAREMAYQILSRTENSQAHHAIQEYWHG